MSGYYLPTEDITGIKMTNKRRWMLMLKEFFHARDPHISIESFILLMFGLLAFLIVALIRNI